MEMYYVTSGIKLLVISRKALPRHEDMMTKFVILALKEK